MQLLRCTLLYIKKNKIDFPVKWNSLVQLGRRTAPALHRCQTWTRGRSATMLTLLLSSPHLCQPCNGICSSILRRSACSSAFILVHLASAPELSERRLSTNTPMVTSVFKLFNMRINIHTSTYRITLLVPKYAIVRVVASWPPLITSVLVLCWSYIAHCCAIFLCCLGADFI